MQMLSLDHKNTHPYHGPVRGIHTNYPHQRSDTKERLRLLIRGRGIAKFSALIS